MKSIRLILSLFAVFGVFAAFSEGILNSPTASAASSQVIKIVNYNVKCTQCATEQARWTYKNRGNGIVNYLNSGFDIAGLNEVSMKARVGSDPDSWSRLKSGLSGFTAIKAWQSKKTYYPDTALFTKNSTIQVLSSNYSKTTGNIKPNGRDKYNEERPITYAKLRQKSSGVEFVVVSAHFTSMGYDSNNISETATALRYIDKQFGKNIPIIFMGDFYIWGCNTGNYSEPYGTFVKYGYKDAFDAKVAQKRLNLDYNTYVVGRHPGGTAAKCGTSDGRKQYDHIFVRGGLTVNRVMINTGKLYSDHLPVEVDITLGGGSTSGTTGSSSDSTTSSGVISVGSSQISADEVGIPTPSTDSLLKNILNAVYYAAGITAVGMIVFAGYKYILSSGEPGKIKRAKDTLLYAVIGIIIVLIAFVITNFVISGV